jgi:hypothetical protein
VLHGPSEATKYHDKREAVAEFDGEDVAAQPEQRDRRNEN